MIAALIWDVDGTLAETEHEGHLPAFNEAFAEAGLPWRWDEERYRALLQITGGRERLLHDFRERPDAPADAGEREALARRLHQRKNAHYATRLREGRVALREGVAPLMREAQARGLRLAIATTTSRENVDVLLSAHLGRHWQRQFAAVVCGEDVVRKKPDPQVYLQVLRALGVYGRDCLALEDSPAGVAAARAAGIPVVLTESRYFAGQETPGALARGPGLHTAQGWDRAPASAARDVIDLDTLIGWARAS